MPSDEYVCSGWACTDCLILLANGENPTDMTEEEISAWHAKIETRNASYNVTLGMRREEHACAYNFTVTSPDKTTHHYRASSFADATEQHAYQTSGFLSEHELRTVGEDGGECNCETRTFSSSPCDYCGSNLGGERHAISFFKILL